MKTEKEIQLQNSFWSSDEVLLQSMTNVPVADIDSSIEQIDMLVEEGCRAVRLSLPTLKDVQHLKEVLSILSIDRNEIKIIADVHFDVDIAIAAAMVADKVRINPGNFLTKTEIALPDEERLRCLRNKIEPLIQTCKAFSTTLRIGVNQGSVYKGNSPLSSAQELVEEMMDYIDIINDLNFHDLVLSIKSSDPWLMIESNSLLSKTISSKDLTFPIHLGVTESGNNWEGRIRSTIGIGTCLVNGIGNTIRVSLTENPVAEIPVAKSIVELSGSLPSALKGLMSDRLPGALNLSRHLFDNAFVLHELAANIDVSKSWSGDMIYRSEEKDEVGSDLIHPAKAISLNKLRQNHQFEKGTFLLAEVNEIPDIIRKSIELPILVNSSIDGLSDTEILSNALVIAHLLKRKLIDGLYLKSNDQRTYLNHLSILSELLLQGAGRQVGSSIVSCPGCARSGINLEMLNGQIRELTSNSKVSISLMGCGINGYGEMMKSDIGLISSSPGKVDVYVKKQLLKAAVAEIDVVDELKEILENGIEA